MSSLLNRAPLRPLAEAALLAETGARVRRVCPRCGSADHGRPVAIGPAGDVPHVSIAYAQDLAVVAWSWDRPVGVDVEPSGPDVPEWGDRASWTRLEAVLKADGTGLHRDPAAVPPDEAWTVALPLPDGYVGTAALLGEGEGVVSWRAVGPAAGSG